MLKKIKIFFFIISLLTSYTINASDFIKEQRWANQIVDFLIDGEAEWLTINNHKILAIYTEASPQKPTNAAIIIHGSGVHPNWEDVIQPLRTALPERGWNTLSIQMPILSGDASYSDYADIFNEVAPRVNAAISHLKTKGAKNITIIAHSLGSTMSAYYLASNKNDSITSFVAIGMPGGSDNSRMDNITHLTKINIPMLDLFGSNDLSNIIRSAKTRSAASKHNRQYTQIMTQDANHFFADKNDELIKTVASWLNK